MRGVFSTVIPKPVVDPGAAVCGLARGSQPLPGSVADSRAYLVEQLTFAHLAGTRRSRVIIHKQRWAGSGWSRFRTCRRLTGNGSRRLVRFPLMHIAGRVLIQTLGLNTLRFQQVEDRSIADDLRHGPVHAGNNTWRLARGAGTGRSAKRFRRRLLPPAHG